MSLNKRIIPGFAALLLFSSALQAASLDTVVIKSKALGSKPKAVVVVPDSYNQVKDYFPVLYLLHGWSGSFQDWPDHIDLRPLSDRYQMIIVCPDGGYAGWYLDSPIPKESQYETYLSQEVIRYIDKHYRTVADSEGRFICGLSMGGHGAVRMLAKHPELYAAAGSMSGVLALTATGKKYGIVQLIGPSEDYPERWAEYSCLNLVDTLAGLNKGLIVDCGIDDFTIDVNREMHKQLMELGIFHDYYERPGGHSWDYWTNALEYHIIYFDKFKKRQN
ncbi:esterase family protein [bacterium]|nr:esterase family protein [bacterium]MBU1064927.1 esterase family protein [bacterium]MBU1874896.1 esterase family protein [bacterium]